jgi:DNA-binding NtrC family response regulator
MNNRILVIDDDENLLKSIKKILTMENYLVDTLINALQAENIIEEQKYQCVLLDVKMPMVNGIEILHRITHKVPTLPIIMISGQSNIETAVESIKDGAYDFIEKPINPERLVVTVKNALQKFELQQLSDSIFEELKEKFNLVGQSNALKNIIKQIKDISITPAKVLILGESGTGKELVAWAIHYNSHRKGFPYIKINCAAIPAELLESELFGHRKGSFTGALTDRRGKFSEANGGTLFLDEIGDMHFQLQSKLLRVLEEKEIQVIGENLPQKVDVRIIAATNKNLEDLVAQGKFREDLYYRLNVAKIIIPPLRNRKEDILPLAYYFLKEFCDNYNKQMLTLKKQAETILINYNWPGNVRQLKNVIEKIVIFAPGNEIGYKEAIAALELDNSEYDIFPDEKDHTLKNTVHNFEKSYILRTLQKHDWKISETASILGIDRSNLFKKMKKYDLNK